MNKMKSVLEQIMYPIGVCIMFILIMIAIYEICSITKGTFC